MRMQFIALSGMLCLMASAAMAQSYVESALLFGRTRPGGSARIQAMGGSQIALGGDYSAGLSNPAGLGMYNRSEFTITPGLSTYKSNASYLGNIDNQTTSNIVVPGLSLVIHTPYDKNGFVGGTFGISLSRTNDFNRSTFYHGKNDDSSIIDYFIDDAFGSTTAQFDGAQYNTPTGLGYYNYLLGPKSLIDPNNPKDEYFSDVTTFPQNQQEDIQVTGGSNQWSFAYGANYMDKVFFGASIGVTSLRYKSQKVYTESFNDPVFTDLELNENLNIKGSGLNATLGVTARPVDFVQVGISYTTPTYYQFTETYNASMDTRWKNFDYYGDGKTILNNEHAATDFVTSDYSLTVPGKLNAGVALLSKYGVITGDVEFTNPAKAKYSSETQGISYTQENSGIKSAYQAVMNYRVGGEFRYKIFRARAGYGVQASTYASGIDLDNSIKTISGGVGVRLTKFFIDFALINSSGMTFYSPYTFFDGTGPRVDIDAKTTTGMVTLGFTF